MGRLTFADATLDQLRQHILMARNEQPDLDSAALTAHLGQMGLTPALDRIAREAALVRFAQPETGPDEAARGWHATLADLRRGDLERELEAAQSACRDEPSEANTQWLLRIKSQMLEQSEAELSFE